MKKYPYIISTIDKTKRMVFIEPNDNNVDLSRAFREIESRVPGKDFNKPWRVIYKNHFGVDYEVKIDYEKWPRSYLTWDRRYNPEIKTEKWHGHMWDSLKESA
jgi:hypothetical protein